MPSHEEHHTIHGLHAWFKHLFEKFGWMVLCNKHHDSALQTDAYIESIQRLQKALQASAGQVADADTKRDMQVMQSDLEHLLKAAQSLFTKPTPTPTAGSKAATATTASSAARATSTAATAAVVVSTTPATSSQPSVASTGSTASARPSSAAAAAAAATARRSSKSRLSASRRGTHKSSSSHAKTEPKLFVQE